MKAADPAGAHHKQPVYLSGAPQLPQSLQDFAQIVFDDAVVQVRGVV